MSAACALLLVSTLAAAPVFEDDFESGTLLSTSTPPGQWKDLVNPRSASSALDAAAHRGLFGLRINDRDPGDGGIGIGTQGGVGTSLNADDADALYFRFWLRIEEQMAKPGRSHLVSVGAIAGGALPIFFSLTQPAAGLELGGDSADGTRTDPVRYVVDGQWHLVELGLEGLATTQGSRSFWLDGALVARHENLDFVGTDAGTFRARRFTVGEPWSYVVPMTAFLDYDDVRVTTEPPASRVRLDVGAPLVAGLCNPLQVTLRQSADGGSVAHSEAVALQLSSDGGGFHADPQCARPPTGLSVDAGTLFTTVYLRPNQPGPFGASALDVSGDLLPAVERLTAYALAAAIRAPEQASTGEDVTLDGTGSRARPGNQVSEYRWRQVEGPTAVKLGSGSTVSFNTAVPGTYGFELVVADGSLQSPPARARVLVVGERDAPPERLGGCYCGAFPWDAGTVCAALALFAVLARRRRSSSG